MRSNRVSSRVVKCLPVLALASDQALSFSVRRSTELRVPLGYYIFRRPQIRLHMSTSTTQESSPSSFVLSEDQSATSDVLSNRGSTESLPGQSQVIYNEQQSSIENSYENSAMRFLTKIQEKVGTVSDDRLIFPEIASGEVERLFSALEYQQNTAGTIKSANRVAGSVVGAAALVAGTTVGAGILALPTATAAAGFLPSSTALVVAWIYMTFSGLLIAELTLNQLGNSGRPGVGLLELYKGSLGQPLSQIGSVAYFFLHYAMMVAYIAQGGANVESLLSSLGLENLVDSVPGLGPLAFASACGAGLYATSTAWIERANNLLVFLVAATFLAIVGIGARTADFASLFEMSNQHADQVFSCFPILFLALVYQNVVPTVVTQLEGDRKKIVRAIVGGTTVPLLMFLAWNAVVLGNVYGSGITDLTSLDPVAALQGGAISTGAPLGLLVSAFSSLALITSVIGFTYGLLDAWTDVFALNTRGKDFETWKLPLFGLVFGPPLALSVAIPDVFYQALEYGGAFGVSTLFLVLPPIMVWKERYGKDEKPLITKPLVPFGKLALGSMWKAAGTLIVEQGLEKLGVFELIQQHLSTTHP